LRVLVLRRDGYTSDCLRNTCHDRLTCYFFFVVPAAISLEKQVDCRQATVKKLLDVDGNEWVEGAVIGGVSAAVGDPTEADNDAKKTTQTFLAPLTVVCDGYFSTFRKKLTPAAERVLVRMAYGFSESGDTARLPCMACVPFTSRR
jgi:2-polyprenyl-6-methoxyphenol hydroxylase-like FAD-dependent oxidoreductase